MTKIQILMNTISYCSDDYRGISPYTETNKKKQDLAIYEHIKIKKGTCTLNLC